MASVPIEISERTGEFDPIRVMEVEISKEIPGLPGGEVERGRAYRRGLALVRLHGQPMGLIELQIGPEGLSSDGFASQIWDRLSTEINDHLASDGLPPGEFPIGGRQPLCELQRLDFLAEAPLASVVIATHNRTQSLASTLDHVLALDYPRFEVIVVDNAPSTDATARLVEEKYASHASHGVRLVREDRPGLAIAHNRGLREVHGEIVAFTDDDVDVDRLWLAEIAADFYRLDDVACVTGMILPAELETPAQEWTEQYSGFGKGFRRQVFDLAENRPDHPLFPFAAGQYGSGANMAYRTSILREMHGFDPATGAGTLAMGGDDLAAFFEVITRGCRLVYEPAAMIHHYHRRDYAGLRRQAFGYGVGLTAFLTKTVVDRPGRVFDIVSRIPSGISYMLNPKSPKNIKKGLNYPKELNRMERQGMLYGPVAYLRSRWHTRRRD